MRDSRSASQILFGFLPQQTVDANKGVWRVRGWRSPRIERAVDHGTLRKELCRLAAQWRATGMDGGFVNDLERGAKIEVLSLDERNGVELDQFPKLWVCNTCKRVHQSLGKKCECGSTKKGQLPFVGYHDKCGSLKEPFIKKCKEHKQVRYRAPGTATAKEIIFDCPICGVVIQKAFGFLQCDCGDGPLRFDVHRSASVYTPKSIVIVNPPSQEKIKSIIASGGKARALTWVINGMKEASVEEVETTVDMLRRQLIEQKIDEKLVEQMIAVASQSGQVPKDDKLNLDIDAVQLEDAEDQALTIALAVMNSRLRISDLIRDTDPYSELGILYKDKYPVALQKAGLEAVELLDKFPVLTGQYGYTRGNGEPTESKLNTFRDRTGGYLVYADIAETEALFIKLSAVKVADWLNSRGFKLTPYSDEVSARIAILKSAELPKIGQPLDEITVGSEVFSLIHSYAHRFIRLGAAWAGIDRNSLSELLVPLHLGFYVYAAARGDFVLGGLQAVFESDLDKLLLDIRNGEHRCALDPGCAHSGGACMACLHIGEPSCRFYNTYLSRDVLSGQLGYLSASSK